MKFVFHALSLLAVTLALTSCPQSGGGSTGAVGPYDRNGNYVEAWADDPSKWHHPPRDVGGSSAVAANDLPPPDITPLPSGEPKIILPTSKPTTTVASNPPTRPKTGSGGATTSRTTSRPTATASRTTTKPRTTVARTTTKSKPKPKPAPATVRHTVKKGETLSHLAAKYGTSVSAIQRANKLSGTMIREGKPLTIPRKK